MITEKSGIGSLKKIGCGVREQSIECDIVLPEYYPVIAKILRIGVEPDEEAVTVSGDKISVAGAASVSVLYCGDDHSLNCYTTEVKYTKVLHCDEDVTGCAVHVRQHTVEVNYKATGQKKLDIRASVAVTADVLTVSQSEIACATDEKTEDKLSVIAFREPKCVAVRTLNVNDTENDVGRGDEEMKVLTSSVRTEITDVKTVKNKIKVRGNCRWTVLFLAGQEKTVKKYEHTAEFNEVTDVFGIDENCDCDVQIASSRPNVRFVPGQGSGIRAEISAKVRLLIVGSEPAEKTFVEDCFSVRGGTECDYLDYVFTKDVSCVEDKLTCTTEAAFYDEGAQNVLCAFADGFSCSYAPDAEGVTVNGNYTLNALYLTADGSVGTVIRSASFEYRRSGVNDLLCSVADSFVRCEITGNKAIFGTDLLLSVLCPETVSASLVKDVRETEEQASEEEEHISLYFAESGEKIWDIAKENRVSESRIREMNALTGEIVTENTVLVLANI